ncbi:MAG: hypothetical protein HC896_07265 [Bacteroidales bacterium]|nr:hypothetical protein [Bacteroidales bacterium]
MNKTNKHFRHLINQLLTTLLLAGMVSCGQQPKAKDENGEIAKEVQDVKHDVKEQLNEEKKQLKMQTDSTIKAFDQQLAKIERNIKTGKEAVDKEKEALIKNLKAKRDAIENKFSRIDQQTSETWKAFKTELDHDTKQFAASVKDFSKTTSKEAIP